MPSDIQWIIGFIVAGAVAVVVVLLVGTILYLASQIKRDVLAIHAALEQAEEATSALWDVQETTAVTVDIAGAARQARTALGG